MKPMSTAETTLASNTATTKPWPPCKKHGVAGLLALMLSALIPGVSAAQTSGLPKGYTSDELPPLPQSAPAPTVVQVQDQVTDDPAAAPADDTYVDTDPSALSDFHEPLAAYGTWVDDGTYGTVWVPSATVVGGDFAPYQTAGHWEYTDEGDWLWVSDYDWGYIPFHYGRWIWITGRGWAWIPGRVYAPAWVVFRTSDYGYIGWAPMPPLWYWSGGIAVSLWFTPSAPYVFCPTRHVFHHHVHTYIVRDRDVVQRIGTHSRVYKPADVSAGPTSGDAKAPAGQGGAASAQAPSSGKSVQRNSGAPHSAYMRGPSLSEAKVPTGAEPKVRAASDPRALAFSTRSGTLKAKANPPVARGFVGAPTPGGFGHGQSHFGGRAASPSAPPSPRSPAVHTQPRSPSWSNPGRPNASPFGTRREPSVHSRPASQPPSSFSRPSASPSRSAPAARPSPSRSTPAARPSAPAPRPAAPAARPAAPRSAPAVRSAPSSSSKPSSKSTSSSSKSSSKPSSSGSSKRK